MSEETHTREADAASGGVAYCKECSDIALEWVSWPCSREKLVRAAVSAALHLREMDVSDQLLEREAEGFEAGLKASKMRKNTYWSRFRAKITL